jgi:hypothetical protein
MFESFVKKKGQPGYKYKSLSFETWILRNGQHDCDVSYYVKTKGHLTLLQFTVLIDFLHDIQ